MLESSHLEPKAKIHLLLGLVPDLTRLGSSLEGSSRSPTITLFFLGNPAYMKANRVYRDLIRRVFYVVLLPVSPLLVTPWQTLPSSMVSLAPHTKHSLTDATSKTSSRPFRGYLSNRSLKAWTLGERGNGSPMYNIVVQIPCQPAISLILGSRKCK